MKTESTQPDTTEERYFYLMDYSVQDIPGFEEKIYNMSVLEVGYSKPRGVWTTHEISCIMDELSGDISKYHREESYSTLEPLLPASYIRVLTINDKTLIYPFWETLIKEMEDVIYIE